MMDVNRKMFGRTQEELEQLPIEELRGFKNDYRNPAVHEWKKVKQILKEDCRKNLLPLVTEKMVIDTTQTLPDAWWTPRPIGDKIVRELIGRCYRADVYEKSVAAKVSRILKKSDSFETRRDPHQWEGAKNKRHQYRYTSPELVEARARSERSLRERVEARDAQRDQIKARFKTLGVRVRAGRDTFTFNFDAAEKLLGLLEE